MVVEANREPGARLALGTVQFGLDYGIKNTRGKVPPEEIQRILAYARESGIDTLDTAAAYGESEIVLGRLLEGNHHFGIVSKLKAKPELSTREELLGSLSRLRKETIHAYLLHSFDTYRTNANVLRELADCKKEGLVEKTGVSLYRPEEAEALLDAGEEFSLVQVPYNLLDRRFESVFRRLKEKGVEIHVRSVFLQGAFFMDPHELPINFEPVKDRLEALRTLSHESGASLPSLCLAFAAANPYIDRVVIGVDGLDDFSANVAAFADRGVAEEALKDFLDIRSNDEAILLPFNWTKK